MQNDYFCPGPRFGKKTIYLENFSELKVLESMLGSFMYEYNKISIHFSLILGKLRSSWLGKWLVELS